MERHFAWTPEGARFCDLLTGELLVPDQPPRGVREHPILGAGLRYLRRLSNNRPLTVQLLLSAHGQSGHFREVVAQHGSHLEAATAVAIEADWTCARPRPLAPHYTQVWVRFCNDTARRAKFQEAQTSWLIEHGKIILPCDYADERDQLCQAIQQLLIARRAVAETAFDEAARADDRLSAPDRNRMRVIANGALQLTRQWMMVGQLGYWLWQLEEQGRLRECPIVPLMVSDWHEPLLRWFGYCGVMTESYRTFHAGPSTDPSNYASVFKDTMVRAGATFEQLDIPLPG